MQINYEGISIKFSNIISTLIALVDPEDSVVKVSIGSMSISPTARTPDDIGSLGAFVNCDVGSHTVQ